MLLSATKHYDRQHSTATDDLHRKCLRATDLLYTQVVTSEILMASEMQSCPIEVTKIPISKCDDNFDEEEGDMPFYRAMYDTNTGQNPNMPREQVLDMT